LAAKKAELAYELAEADEAALAAVNAPLAYVLADVIFVF
jgi:hypothetical protein